MLRPKTLGLVNQRRTLRALYAQTQAYPYAAKLDTLTNQSLTDSTSQFQLAGVDSSTGVAGIWPGCVMTRSEDVTEAANGEVVRIAPDATTRPFGLSANFVGGNLDELNGTGNIGVWRGRGGVFEVLAPLFSSAVTASTDTLGSRDEADTLQDAVGTLVSVSVVDSDAGSAFSVARLISKLSANAIIVELTVGG